MKKSIIICADDFGMAPSINKGIITLLQHNKISAVSCMTNQPYWEQDASLLIPFLKRAKVGLHFNLPYKSLGLFIVKSYLRLLNKQTIYKELKSQYENFIKMMGQKPYFIDGHQHIHQLPIIRDVIIDFYQTHYQDQQAFIRNTYNKQRHCLKAKILTILGGARLKKLLEQHHIPHNKNFSGVYNLSEKNDYHSLLTQFIKDIKEDGLIMCHPASSEPTHHELFRVNEFTTLLKKKI